MAGRWIHVVLAAPGNVGPRCYILALERSGLMRYISETTELLSWLKIGMAGAQFAVIACPVDDTGLALLEPELSAMLDAGGELRLLVPAVPASLASLARCLPGNIVITVEETLGDARVAFVAIDGSRGLFLGAASLTAQGLLAAASGIVLDEPRDDPAAGHVIESLIARATSPEGRDLELVRLRDLLEPTMDRIEASGRSTGQLSTIQTGFADLDSLTGGRHAGQRWVLNGPSGIGKTVLALNFARHCAIAQGFEALWLSTRDLAVTLTEQILSAEARVQRQNMRLGKMGDPEWARLARHLDACSESMLFIAEIGREADILHAATTALHSRPGTRLLVVDAIGDSTTPGPLQGLKALAGRTDTWIVAVATPMPGLTLDEVEEHQAADADLILRLDRPGHSEQINPREGEADICVKRHRRGPTAICTVAFQGHYARFVDLTSNAPTPHPDLTEEEWLLVGPDP